MGERAVGLDYGHVLVVVIVVVVNLIIKATDSKGSFN